MRGIYALQVFLALILSTNHKVRLFGVMIMISVIGTFAFFKYAFVSVWCLFAAILSVYLLIALKSEHRLISKDVGLSVAR